MTEPCEILHVSVTGSELLFVRDFDAVAARMASTFQLKKSLKSLTECGIDVDISWWNS